MKLTKVPEFKNPACDGYDTEPFYWFDHESYKNDSVLETLLTLCAGCPERIACGEHGIANEEWGIWGGLTVQARKVIRRKRAKARRVAE